MVDFSRVGHAVSWSAIDVLFRYGLNFAVLIALAHILSPSDFGLLAMLAIFVAVAAVLVDSGFSQALIQRQQTTQVDESTVFFFSIMIGALMGVVLCVLAPWIAAFYRQPILEALTYWMALNLFINVFGTIHTTLLTKRFDFKTIAKVGVISSLVSACVAVYMAMQGWGVWSLVGQVLAATTTSVAMLWILSPWRPQRAFSFASLRTFFGYGGYLLWTGLLYTLYSNLYALLIGKMHSVQAVGYFSQAQRLQQLPVGIITNVVGRVAFPAFSAAAEDKDRLARGLKKGLLAVMFVNIPLMLGLLLLSEPLVSTLFGEKWLPIVPILQVLSIVGLLWPLHILNINVLLAQGYSAINARIQLVKLSVAITLLVLTSPYGLLAIAYGQVIATVIGFFINSHYTGVFLNYGGLAQLRDLSPYLLASLPMGAVIVAVTHFAQMTMQMELFVAVVLGGAIYLATCRLAKLAALESFMSVILRRR